MAQQSAAGRNQRRLTWALLVTGGFMVVEAVGGWLSGSLALLADAGHMLTDTLALTLALFAFRLGARPSDPRRSYGYQRAQVLAALANGAALTLIVGWIAIEAVSRLLTPAPIDVQTMLIVAALGLLANTCAFLILHGADRGNLNMRAATLHVLSDLLGSVAALAAGVLILAFGWLRVDPLLSLLVAALVFRTALQLLRQSAHILLEGTPDWVDIEAIKRRLTETIPGVNGVHHVHAWCLTHEQPLLTLHADVEPGSDQNAVLRAVKSVLSREFRLEHSTVQLEAQGCADNMLAAGDERRHAEGSR